MGLMITSAWAIPSTKFTARYSKMVVMTNEVTASGSATDDTSKTHVATVKVPNKKELLVGVSIQTSIDTQTTVKGKNGSGGSATAAGRVAVLVELTNEKTGEVRIAEPGLVIFDARQQELSAILGGVIDSCTDSNGDGTIVVEDECVVTPEEISLLLSTTGAHHFNFLAPNLAAGVWQVSVIVTLDANASVNDVLDSISDCDTGDNPNACNDARAKAVIGPRMITIQTVQGANNPDSIIEVD